MKKITISDYEEAIKAKYDEVKEGEHQEFLDEPTPAGLKRLCLLLLNNIDLIDLGIYRHFFFLKDGKDFYEQVNNFDTTKFRALQKFLKGGSERSSEERLNLLAILVDLQPRPYQKFRKQESIIAEQVQVAQPETKKEQVKQIVSFYGSSNPPQNLEEEIEPDTEEKAETEAETKEEAPDSAAYNIDGIQPNKKSPDVEILPQKYFAVGRDERKQARANLIKLLVIVLLFFVVVGFAFKDYFLDSSGCMVWKGDHYEEADCNDTQIQSFAGSYNIISMDRKVFKFMKKIKVTDTTAFRNSDGSTCLWYGKSANKEYEFFSCPGLHPETLETLKKVTPYIFNKYVKNKD